MITRIRAEVKTVVDRLHYHCLTDVSIERISINTNSGTGLRDNKKANHDFKNRN